MNALGFPSYTIVGTPSGGALATIPINTNTPDAFGSYWFLDGDVQGWDSADMRVTMLTKIGSDVNAEGELTADLHYRGRSLVLKLYCEAESEVARENSRLLLAQACNTSAMTFTANENVPKQLSVVRSGNTNQGKLTMAEKGYPAKAAGSQTTGTGASWGLPVGKPAYILETSVELYARDPFKYAVTPVVKTLAGGTVSFTNPGTYPSMNAVIDLPATGGGAGPVHLITPERNLRLLVPVIPAGAPALSPVPGHLVVDLYNQLIYDGAGGPGANYYYLRDMQTPWLRVPAGVTSLSVTPSMAGTLTYSPAWL